MNSHYHPYVGQELSPTHSTSPENNNYHVHPDAESPHNRMHPSNGHNIGGPMGLTGMPHQNQQPLHGRLQHPPSQQQQQQHLGYSNGPPNQDGQPHHLMHNPSLSNNNSNNHGNNNNNTKICAGCGAKIVERFLLHALDRYWHNGCLKCSCCAVMLADIGTSCFTKSGMILCKQDYMRIFGNSGACSACHQAIPASEFVMRCGDSIPQAGNPPQVFHLKCFQCSKCGAHLMPGDRYNMVCGSLVCEQDWSKLLKTSNVAPTVRKGKVGRPRRSRD